MGADFCFCHGNNVIDHHIISFEIPIAVSTSIGRTTCLKKIISICGISLPSAFIIPVSYFSSFQHFKILAFVFRLYSDLYVIPSFRMGLNGCIIILHARHIVCIYVYAVFSIFHVHHPFFHKIWKPHDQNHRCF